VPGYPRREVVVVDDGAEGVADLLKDEPASGWPGQSAG
jgi:hypothetical protein